MESLNIGMEKPLKRQRLSEVPSIEYPEDRLIESFHARNPEVPFIPLACPVICCQEVYQTAVTLSTETVSIRACGNGTGEAATHPAKLLGASPGTAVRMAADGAHAEGDVQEDGAGAGAEAV